MPIKLISGAGGSLTVQPASTASNYTLTVPAVTANVVTTGDSNTITQTMMNTGFYGGYGPAFSAYRASGSGNQSVTNNTQNAIACDTKLFDTAGCYNNTGSPVTLNGLSVPAYAFCPNVAGYYQINGRADTYASSGLNFGQANLYKNGSNYKSGGLINISATEIALTFSGLVYLNGSGDYVNVYGYVNGSAGTVFLAGQNNLWFDGFLARAG